MHRYDNSGGICPPSTVLYDTKRLDQRQYEQELQRLAKLNAQARAEALEQTKARFNKPTSVY